MFGSVVVVAFQITFRVEMHVNDIFLFFKNYFWHQHIKTIQNILNFNKKIILNFLETRVAPRSKTVSYLKRTEIKEMVHGDEGHNWYKSWVWGLNWETIYGGD